MDDLQIIELFHKRSELALVEIKKKYNSYLQKIAMNILHDLSDCEECINDAYLTAWKKVPPDQPNNLKIYLGRFVRCFAIDLYRKNKSRKRYNGFTILLSELEECLVDIRDLSESTSSDEIKNSINNWLNRLEQEKRVLFVRRYWYGQSLRSLSKEFDMSESKAKSLMLRLRVNLREYLEKEGISI